MQTRCQLEKSAFMKHYEQIDSNFGGKKEEKRRREKEGKKEREKGRKKISEVKEEGMEGREKQR